MPIVETVEALLDGALEIGGRTALAFRREIFKIILVQHHASVFKSQTTRELGISRVFPRRLFVADDFSNLLGE